MTPAMILTAFGDETGTHNDSPVMRIAASRVTGFPTTTCSYPRTTATRARADGYRALALKSQFGTQAAALISPNSRAILRQEAPASSLT